MKSAEVCIEYALRHFQYHKINLWYEVENRACRTQPKVGSYR